MEYACAHCSALHWLDEKTTNSLRHCPEFGMCCNHGQVQLPYLQPPPAYLYNLFTSNDGQAKKFRDNIVQYNSALAFTSVGVKIDNTVNCHGRGPPVFRIHGELKHWSGALLPREGSPPAYAQLYILDPQTALQYRMHHNENLHHETMLALQNLLQAVNPYARAYLHAYEILCKYPDARDLSIRLRIMPGQDRRRYNLPTADEVAVVVPGDGTQVVDTRDIILSLRPNAEGFGCGALQRVNDGNAAYAPLHYVLLFP
ncbi:uncharacterized protein C8R40DRAFT_1058173, partial [Lentinula edodes]|uniref:uncharacterized protein n=1 Tax=Lentinula edodes TaxID=5353 RepID=UPI001E8D3312